MNQSQIDIVLNHIAVYNELNLKKLLADKYANEQAINEVMIGQFTTQEFLSTCNKVMHQFSEELNSPYAKSLPYQYHFHNEYGSSDLNQDLTGLLNQFRAGNFPAAITHLNRLVHYQAVNGFWEKSKRKYFRTTEASLIEEQERIGLVSEHLSASSNRLTDLLSEIEQSKSELDRFTKVKNEELSEIKSLLDSSRNHSEEINKLLNQATASGEKINSVLAMAEENQVDSQDELSEIKKMESQLKAVIADLEQKIGQNNKKYDQLRSEFDKKLEFVESKRSYFEERNTYLDDLIGREVGTSLFETFKQRKTEIGKYIWIWQLSVPVAAIATIAWVFYLFGNGSLSDLSWQTIVVNSLKALPALGLLGFAISQYTKERNFQEEYAFKSAVALTINAYADQLHETDHKDRLIMDSVERIYRTPLHKKEKSQKDIDALASTTKSISDQLKETLNKVSS